MFLIIASSLFITISRLFFIIVVIFQQEEERLRQDKAEREEKLKKPFQQLFVSSPDGLRVEYMNDYLYPSEGDMGGVLVRQGYPVKSQVSQGGERIGQTPAAGEIWRTITTNGTVIKVFLLIRLREIVSLTKFVCYNF